MTDQNTYFQVPPGYVEVPFEEYHAARQEDTRPRRRTASSLFDVHSWDEGGTIHRGNVTYRWFIGPVIEDEDTP